MNSHKAGVQGSHMPLDTDSHWQPRNPLNIILTLVLLVVLLAIIGSIAVLI